MSGAPGGVPGHRRIRVRLWLICSVSGTVAEAEGGHKLQSRRVCDHPQVPPAQLHAIQDDRQDQPTAPPRARTRPEAGSPRPAPPPARRSPSALHPPVTQRNLEAEIATCVGGVGAVLLVNGKPAVRTRSPAPRSERVLAPPARSGGNGPTEPCRVSQPAHHHPPDRLHDLRSARLDFRPINGSRHDNYGLGQWSAADSRPGELGRRQASLYLDAKEVSTGFRVLTSPLMSHAPLVSVVGVTAPAGAARVQTHFGVEGR